MDVNYNNNQLSLTKLIKSHDPSMSVFDFLNYLRNVYLKQEVPFEIKKICEQIGIKIPSVKIDAKLEEKIIDIINKYTLKWADGAFHLKYRITHIYDLVSILPDIEKQSPLLAEIIENGYLLSVLPLNLISPEEVLTQFIPPSDFSIPHPVKHTDPYGIGAANAKIIKENIWIASKKFNHSVLMNIHGHCPIGCSDCYKSYFTREKGHEAELGAGDPYEMVPIQLESQAKLLVDWLNVNPSVYDVIISGGEPFLRPNSHIKLMLNEFKRAKDLKILRFCTGAIFLGLPFRIDNELLDIIKEFSLETGVKITFQAHLSNHLQITPEAVTAVENIKARGFNIYSQTPIKAGINFFLEDVDKTIFYLKELVKRQFILGIEPYKFIIDMHPRTLAYFVPIELLTKVFSYLFDSHSIPELERPKTLSILTKQGNLILLWHSLFAMKKRVDVLKKVVEYHIPKIAINGNNPSIENFIYEEPLCCFNENPNSLEEIKLEWFR